MIAPRASIHPIAPDTWRVSIALPPELFPGGFSFNQYLVVDERPLLFHTGPKKLFGLVRGQIETVLPVARLRYIAFCTWRPTSADRWPTSLRWRPRRSRSAAASGPWWTSTTWSRCPRW